VSYALPLKTTENHTHLHFPIISTNLAYDDILEQRIVV